MKPTRRNFVKATGAAALGAAGLSQQVSAVEPAENRFLIDLDEVPDRSWQDAVSSVIRTIDEIGIAVVEASEQNLQEYPHSPDLKIKIEPPLSHQADIAPDEIAAVPDPAPLQWDKYYQKIPELHDSGITGDGVRIAILDQGIDPDHPDLAPNLDRDASENYTSGPGDDLAIAGGHGTHVAGIAAGAGEELVVGTAPDATLISSRIQAVNAPYAYDSDILAAIVGSASDAQADVANISFGAYPVPASVDRAVTREAYDRAAELAHEVGMLIVTSAGNSDVNLNTDGDVLSTPTEYPGYMSVSATGPVGFEPGSKDTNDPPGAEAPPHTPAAYTTYGPNAIDLSAEGGNLGKLTGSSWYYDLVFSCYPTEMGSYAWLAGTSMASPQVAGAAALIKARNLSAHPQQVWNHLENTANQIEYDYGDVLVDVGSGPRPLFGTSNSVTVGDLELEDPYKSTTYRGAGHLDVTEAVNKSIPFPGGLHIRGEQYFPQDLDADGLYEDVNGDGVVDMDDAQLLYQFVLENQGRSISAFDFNGDGRFDQYDVQEFIRQID